MPAVPAARKGSAWLQTAALGALVLPAAGGQPGASRSPASGERNCDNDTSDPSPGVDSCPASSQQGWATMKTHFPTLSGARDGVRAARQGLGDEGQDLKSFLATPSRP